MCVHMSTDEMLAGLLAEPIHSIPRDEQTPARMSRRPHPCMSTMYVCISSWPVPCIRPLPTPVQCGVECIQHHQSPSLIPLATGSSQPRHPELHEINSSLRLRPRTWDPPLMPPGRANPRETGGCTERSPRDPSSAIYMLPIVLGPPFDSRGERRRSRVLACGWLSS